MSKPYVLLDMNNLCHIAHYSTGNLSNDEKKTGVLFGVMKQLLSLVKKTGSNRFVFFWDSRKSFRKEIYPEYKANRKHGSHDEDRQSLYNQITEMRRDIIPGLGFSNSYMQSGYEADDLITFFMMNHPDHEHIVVSTDQDLYQTIRKNRKIYNPIKKEFITVEVFKERFGGLEPINYRIIKQITGCSSDNVKGIHGIGEKTVVKYLKAEINNSEKFKEIQAQRTLIDFNEKLVYLPYIHGPVPINELKTRKNTLSSKKFRNIFNTYSFNSFLKEFDTWEKHFGLK